MEPFKDVFLSRFRWIEGHADMVGFLADGACLAAAVSALAAPYRETGITKVAAVEARGFILGAGVALELGAGFVAIRKPGAVHPGEKVERRTDPDWRRRRHVLRLQRSALDRNDYVLLVDDWAEVGSQATTAKALIKDCGARYAGLTLLVDELTDEARGDLAPVHAVVFGYELPKS